MKSMKESEPIVSWWHYTVRLVSRFSTRLITQIYDEKTNSLAR